jgi:hypothetical protein
MVIVSIDAAARRRGGKQHQRPERIVVVVSGCVSVLEFGRSSIAMRDATLRAAEQAAEDAPRHFDLSYDNMPEHPALARFYERIIT